MKISTLTVSAAAFLFSAVGLAQVRVFRDINFGGPNEYLIFDQNQCMRLGNGWEDEISSVELDQGFECRFFWERDCKDTDTVPVYPGRTYFGAANDKFSSYMCWDT